ncbi:nitrate reductase NapAB chaperone NapD [Ereboglobus sp. PH5-10]|uniref:hypothetical protein n=1 Tax=Ereboglobus sp. PH5-10 TaxID=2940629 RepID=UPI002404A604|nr:hypothetical protein [Ereboglobus sp. PH5-10]MDF9827619.1 nitrate reductase NapAB chaperone NapD [Ereboglobus sp. PH5-10]
MKIPQEAPKLNPLPFIIADIVLLVLAIMVALESPSPIPPASLITITLCVCLGAVLACLPVVLNHTRQRDKLLDERQDQIVALTQAAAAAANQISILTTSLHDIADTNAKMLKHADTLPTRLQEKIGDVKTQLNEIASAEIEALEQEVNTLRASETERLENALDAVKKFSNEILTRETNAQTQSDETARKLGQLSGALDAAIKALPAQIAAALDTAREKLGQSVDESIERRNKEMLARFAGEITALENKLKDLSGKLSAAQTQPASKTPAPEKTSPPPPSPTPPAHIQAQPKNTPKADDSVASNTDDTPAATSAPPFKKNIAHPPSTPRLQEKTKPEKTPNTSPKPDAPKTPGGETPGAAHANKTESPQSPAPPPPTPPVEPQPEAPPPDKPKPVEDDTPKPEPAPPPPPRKRAASKPKPPRDEEPMLDLDLPPPSDEYSQGEPEDGGFSSAMSADGVTRLIVTAYIGIGNKLYIRGDGPGLSWNKGVPLQFISIGKWRWETNDAVAPVSFKLYKNDSVECTRIGAPKLEPGHQHEITADF